MPIRTKLTVEADADKFKQSFALFQKYQEALKNQYGAYVNQAPHIKAAAAAGGDVLRFLDLDQAARSQTKFATSAEKAQKAFHALSTGVHSSLEHVGRSLMPSGAGMLPGMGAGMLAAGPLGWIVAGVSAAVIAAIGVGVGGFRSLERGAAGVSEQRRRAMGLGVAYGSPAAFDLDFARFGAGAGTLDAVAGGVYDFTNPAYLGLRSAGVTAKATDDAAIALIRAIPRLFRGTPAGQDENMARSLGLDSILDLQTIVRLKNHPDEIEDQVKKFQADRQAFSMPKDAQEKWAAFDAALRSAGQNIESAFGKNLVSLTGPLDKFSAGANKIIDAMVDSGLVTDGIHKLEGGLTWIDRHIGSDQFKKGSRDFIDALSALEPYGKKLGLISKLAYSGIEFTDEVLNGLLAAAQGNGKALFHWLIEKNGLKAVAGWLGSEARAGLGYVEGAAGSAVGAAGSAVSAIGSVLRGDPNRGRTYDPTSGHLVSTPTPGAYNPSSGTGWNASVGAIPAGLLARVQAQNPSLSPRQCVELVQSMMHVGNVHDWRRGPSERDSPEGAALATFGVHGDSDFYAYGGSGTPGAGRDHAVKLIKKYPDGSFDALSQDAHHAPHLIHMPWTGLGGEGDASSYYGIFNSSGPAGDNAQLFGPRSSSGSAAEHILNHIHSAPPPSVVVHDMTGGASQVTISRHQAAL